MNIKQTNRANMIDAVIAFLDQHNGKVAESTGFVEAVDQVKELAEAISLKDNEKNGHSNGKTTKNDLSEKALVKHVLKISHALFLWAKKNNNIEIKDLATITKSSFLKLRDKEKVNVAIAIYEAANGKDLAFSKINAAAITQLNTLATQYKNDIAGVSTGANNRIAAGQSLESMLDEAALLLSEECDKYMFQYIDENEEFYNGYKSARVIWDKGGSKNGNDPSNPTGPVNP